MNLSLFEEKSLTLNDQQCPACNTIMKKFFEIDNVPVNSNRLWKTPSSAKICSKGDIKLFFCLTCGLIKNVSFQQEKIQYDQLYENSLFYSTNFQTFARQLTNRLINRYDLIKKNIIEIGLGKSHFLNLFCELGNNKGIYFDPTYRNILKNIKNEAQITIIPDFYSDKYKQYPADFIFSWHVLEHLGDPIEFIKHIWRATINQENTHLFFGVPNGLHNFRHLNVWDIIYEHCYYFTFPSLRYIFSSLGFSICELVEEHEGQSICIDVKHIVGQSEKTHYDIKDDVKNIADDISSFASKYPIKISDCEAEIKYLIENDMKPIIWGAGSRGVTFLNTLSNLNIEFAVDINPRKQGMYVPGTGQEIVSPDFLVEYQPDIVIIMNSIYTDEIKSYSRSLGIQPKFITI